MASLANAHWSKFPPWILQEPANGITDSLKGTADRWLVDLDVLG